MQGVAVRRPRIRERERAQGKTRKQHKKQHQGPGRMVYLGFRDAYWCWRARLTTCRVDGHQPWPYRSGLEMFCSRCHTNMHWTD